MSASKNTPPSNVTSDEVDAAVNMASLSSSTLTMDCVARQFMRGFQENTSKPTNNPPESTVEVEATSTVADEEVQVLEGGPKKLDVRCSRIFNRHKPDAKPCTNWAVEDGRARKAKYCFDCALELKERDSARKRRERDPSYVKKRKIKQEKTGEEEKSEEIETIPQEEMQKEEQKLEIIPQKVELVAQEKVAPLIQGYNKIRVIIPSLALLSQIVGLRFMFHQDMDSIGRDSSWFKVEDSLQRTTRGENKTIGHYLPFGWEDTDWQHVMRQWAIPHQLCVVKTLMKEIKEVLPNKSK